MAPVFLIPDGLAGERLDATAARITGLSRSQIESLIAADKIRLDGVAQPKSTRVSSGQMLDVELPEARSPQAPERVLDIPVVFEDRDLIVIDKPAGVAAHPSLGWDGPSVTEQLAAAGVQIATSGAPERQGVVQRLDVGTTGLMVLAKSESAYSILKQAFRDREVHKVYHALVQGHPDPLTGTIDAPIARHPGAQWKMAIVAGGRESITHYSTLEAHSSASLLEVHLETGRTHQIRVHMAAAKHPCCGDPLYGCDPVLARRLRLQRQWLHAVELAFVHPRSGEQVAFESPYPDDLVYALEIIRAG